MLIFRAILIIFAIAVTISVAMFFVTHQRKYLSRAALLFKLAIVAGLLFFAVLLLEKIF